LTSITCNGTSLAGSAATFTYSAGKAYWSWHSFFGMTTGSYSCGITHM
jgi:hypothetical protein